MPSCALVVDDHPIVRNALSSSLLSLGVFDAVNNAESFNEMLEKLEHDTHYQIIILDLNLSDISSADGMVYLREHYPDIPVIVFSASDSSDIISRCFEQGVHGFVSKQSSMDIFISAIRLVLSGGIYVPREAIGMMGLEGGVVSGESSLPAEESQINFTPKQQQVFDQLMLGVPNKIIARRLGMAEGTVKTHLHGIYQILRVHNRAQAILRAQQIRGFS